MSLEYSIAQSTVFCLGSGPFASSSLQTKQWQSKRQYDAECTQARHTALQRARARLTAIHNTVLSHRKSCSPWPHHRLGS